MKKLTYLSLLAASMLLAASCAPDRLQGEWDLESIVLNDSVFVRPAEEAAGTRQFVEFKDNTYHIATNCNSVSGTYTLKGDSLTLGDGAMTELACDNMVSEDLLRLILPQIRALRADGDSTLRLTTDNPETYILLKKSPSSGSAPLRH